MMYLVELEREIELQPCFFGPRLREVLEQKLLSEVSAHAMPMPLHVCLQVKRHFLNSACSSSAFEHHASTLDVLKS